MRNLGRSNSTWAKQRSSTLAVRAVGGADDTCTVTGLPNRHNLPAAPGMILKNSCEGIKNLTRTQY